MRFFKIAQEFILYRGAPEIDRTPQPREYGAAFFTRDSSYAASYGPVVNAYNAAGLNFLNLKDGQNPKAVALVERFFRQYGEQFIKSNPLYPMDTTIQSEDDIYRKALLFLFPTPDWIEFLTKMGYDGTINDDKSSDIVVIDTGKLEFLGIVDPETGKLQPE